MNLMCSSANVPEEIMGGGETPTRSSHVYITHTYTRSITYMHEQGGWWWFGGCYYLAYPFIAALVVVNHVQQEINCQTEFKAPK